MEWRIQMRISNTKIYEQVADDITEKIKIGELAIGERLPSIQKLAQHYEVSVASVREALNALKILGLIEIKHGQGTFVKQKEPQFLNMSDSKLSASDIRDLLELREVVEMATVKKAAERRTPENLAELKSALAQMEQAIQEGTSGEEGDLAFHLAIAKSSHNALLFDLLNNISDLIQQSMKETRKIYIYNKEKTMEKLKEEHRIIFEAIATQEMKQAEEMMEHHLTEIRNTLISTLEI